MLEHFACDKKIQVAIGDGSQRMSNLGWVVRW